MSDNIELEKKIIEVSSIIKNLDERALIIYQEYCANIVFKNWHDCVYETDESTSTEITVLGEKLSFNNRPGALLEQLHGIKISVTKKRRKYSKADMDLFEKAVEGLEGAVKYNYLERRSYQLLLRREEIEKKLNEDLFPWEKTVKINDKSKQKLKSDAYLQKRDEFKKRFPDKKENEILDMVADVFKENYHTVKSGVREANLRAMNKKKIGK